MRKLYDLISCLTISAAVFISVSCEVQNPEDTDGTTGQTPSGMGEIKATVPSSEGSLDVIWENKDAIALRFQDDENSEPEACTYIATLPAPKSVATFKRKSGEKNLPTKLNGKYFAVYPANGSYIQWENDANVVIAPSANQTVQNKKFDRTSAFMAASSENSDFTFKHLVSYIKFTISSKGSSFSSITVTSADKSQYMVSPIKVHLGNDFTYSILTGSDDRTKNYVSLKNSNNTNLPTGTYYIAINPGTYSKGFKVTFENASGHTATKDYTGSYKPKPGDVVDLGEVGNLGFQMSLPHIKVYSKNNQKLGVVFYQDPTNAGKQKVVSSFSTLTPWAKTNDKWRIHLYKEDYDYVHTVVTTTDTHKADPSSIPAVKFCDQMRKDYGGNWHVPSLTELNMLFNAYYGKEYDNSIATNAQYTDTKSKSAASYFDSLLESMGVSPLLDKSNEYWICGQNSNGNMQYVNMKVYKNGNAVQTDERYVRCVRDVDSSVPDDKVVYPMTDIGRLIKGEMSKRILDVTKDEVSTLAEGLDYYKMTVLTDAELSANRLQHIYMLRVDLSKGLELKSVISNKTTSKSWQFQKLSEMAANTNTTSKPLYAMINADFCDQRDPSNLKPRGPVHCGGKIWQSVYNLDVDYPQQGLSYVGMTNDGKMTIGYREDYAAAKSTLKDCSGAGLVLLEDSKIVGLGDVRDPRTAIGYTANNIIWILVVDGRHATSGMTYTELSSILQGVGCVSAVALDGGGSSQLLGRIPTTGKIQMLNWPSDPTEGAGGEERPRLNAWAIVKK